MNTTVRQLVQLRYANKVYGHIIQSNWIAEATPILEWMVSEIDVLIHLALKGKTRKQVYKTFEQADEVTLYLSDLGEELDDVAELQGTEGTTNDVSLYLASTVTHLLDDMYSVSRECRSRFSDLVDAAYRLEELIPLGKEEQKADSTRATAGAFINAFHNKLNTYNGASKRCTEQSSSIKQKIQLLVNVKTNMETPKTALRLSPHIGIPTLKVEKMTSLQRMFA